jgi:cell division protein FtsL
MGKLETTILFLRNHYGKILTGTTGTIIFSVAGTIFSDARYAHAVDVKKNDTEIRQTIEDMKREIKDLSRH